MNNIIAVDTGRRHVKFAGMKDNKPWSGYMYSITAQAHNDTFGTGDETTRLNQTISFKFNEKKVSMFLSKLADTHGYRAKDNRQNDWYSSQDYHGLTYAAIGHTLIHCNNLPAGDVNKDITLILALPVAHFYASNNGVYMRDLIAGMYSGKHDFQFRNRNFNLNVSCLVLPQSYSSFLDHVCDFQGHDINSTISNARVGIIDVGGETIDLSTIVEREVPKFAQRGTNLGVNRLIKRLENYISEHFHGHKFASPLDAERILTAEKPTFIYNGQEHDITKAVETMRNDWMDDIIQYIKPQDDDDGWQPAAMSTMIFTGGASKQLDQKRIVETFPHARFATDPSKSNVLGMLKYGIGMAIENKQHEKEAA